MTKDSAKTKARLLEELEELRRRARESEALAGDLQLAQARLLRSEKSLRGLFNATDDTTILLDLGGRILDLNRVAAGRLGGDMADLVGRDVFSLVSAELAASRRERFEEARRSRQGVRWTDERGGRTMESSVYPILDERGDVARFALFARDVTEQVRTEEALWQTTEHLSLIIEHLPLVPFTSRAQGDFAVTYVSPGIRGLTGYGAEEFLSTPSFWVDNIHPEDRGRVMDGSRRLLAEGSLETEYRWRVADGGYRWFISSARLVSPADGSEPYLVGLFYDVTQRRQVQEELAKARDELESRVADRTRELNKVIIQLGKEIAERTHTERALRRSEERYRLLFERMLSGFALHEIILDEGGRPRDYRFLEVNPAFERLTGLSARDVVGRTVLEVLPGTEPFWIETYGRVALTGKPAEFEQYAGALDKHFKVTAYSPETGYFASMFNDITQRKRAEEEAKVKQQQLIQADKMVSLGILGAGVAHEINNPNNFIMLNTPILKEAWRGVTPVLESYYEAQGDFMVGGLPYSEMRGHVPELLEGVAEGSERIRRIVQNIKDFARQEADAPMESVDLNAVVRAAQVLLSNQLKKSTTRFSVEFAPDLPKVSGSFQRLEQVVVNVVLNACDALDGPDRAVSIATFYDPEACEAGVRVADEGGGMDPETMRRILDPFFTTKRASGGLGLGLSISQAIAMEHGGELRFDSRPGQGTTVTFALPAMGTTPSR